MKAILLLALLLVPVSVNAGPNEDLVAWWRKHLAVQRAAKEAAAIRAAQAAAVPVRPAAVAVSPVPAPAPTTRLTYPGYGTVGRMLQDGTGYRVRWEDGTSTRAPYRAVPDQSGRVSNPDPTGAANPHLRR